ncbi:hypothetical protein GCM10022209_57480 [Chitinophaga oryziterrae]
MVENVAVTIPADIFLIRKANRSGIPGGDAVCKRMLTACAVKLIIAIDVTY